MPPPKANIFKNKGTPILPPQILGKPSISSIILSPQEEQQFELELCWCIQQLQTALKSDKLNNKQIQDHTKALNTLMCNSASMVKKRQVMRLSFGDYRAKMANEDKKRTKNITNIKLPSATPSKKSVYLKKSTFSSFSNAFRFNFSDSKDITMDVSNTNTNNNFQECLSESCNKNEKKEITKYTFIPGGNSFRFNFDASQKS